MALSFLHSHSAGFPVKHDWTDSTASVLPGMWPYLACRKWEGGRRREERAFTPCSLLCLNRLHRYSQSSLTHIHAKRRLRGCHCCSLNSLNNHSGSLACARHPKSLFVNQPLWVASVDSAIHLFSCFSWFTQSSWQDWVKDRLHPFYQSEVLEMHATVRWNTVLCVTKRSQALPTSWAFS